jgi:hypothetical protein
MARPAPPSPPSPRRAQQPGPEERGRSTVRLGKSRTRSPCRPRTLRERPHGLSRLLTVSQNRCSNGSVWPKSCSPKLTINAGASGGPRSGMGPRPARGKLGSPGEQVSRHIGAAGVAGLGVGVKIVQPWVLHLDPHPKPTPKQARRRDGIPTPHRCLQRRQHPVYDCRCSLACPLRAPSHGHQGSTTVTPVTCRRVPASQISAAQDHDRGPIFQAGHAGLIPVACSMARHPKYRSLSIMGGTAVFARAISVLLRHRDQHHRPARTAPRAGPAQRRYGRCRSHRRHCDACLVHYRGRI